MRMVRKITGVRWRWGLGVAMDSAIVCDRGRGKGYVCLSMLKLFKHFEAKDIVHEMRGTELAV